MFMFIISVTPHYSCTGSTQTRNDGLNMEADPELPRLKVHGSNLFFTSKNWSDLSLGLSDSINSGHAF